MTSLRRRLLAMVQRRPGATGAALISPGMAWLLVFFFTPIVIMLVYSFMRRGVYGGVEHDFTTDHYQRFADPLYVKILLRSVVQSVTCTVLCLLIGYPVAWVMANSGRYKHLLTFLVVLPLWTSVLVRTYAWMVLLGRNGIINRVLIDSGMMETPLAMLNSKMAVVLGMVHVMLPFMILPIYSAVTRIDPDLPKAARGLGASATRVLTTIYIPMTLRGIIAGVTLVFVVSLGFYITPALLGGGKVLMFAMVIEQQVREFLAWNFAGALSVILLAVTLFVFWLLNQGVARHLGD